MDGSDGLGAEGWVEREDGGEVSGFWGDGGFNEDGAESTSKQSGGRRVCSSCCSIRFVSQPLTHI